MTRAFGDSSYFLALLNPEDEYHAQASSFSPSFPGQIVTTAWVLTEVVDALSRPNVRPLGAGLARDCQRHESVEVVPPSQRLFDAGLDLFEQRRDKAWSLTDCISFVVMREHGLSDAFTSDHHFEQAGFTILLK